MLCWKGLPIIGETLWYVQIHGHGGVVGGRVGVAAVGGHEGPSAGHRPVVVPQHGRRPWRGRKTPWVIQLVTVAARQAALHSEDNRAFRTTPSSAQLKVQ